MRKLLPYYFKSIGLGLILLCLILFFVNHHYEGLAGLSENFCKTMLELAVYLGALLIIFSYQKNEHKEIAKTRLKMLSSALLFGVVIFFLDSVLAVVSEPENPEFKSGYDIMIITLFYYILTFHHELWKNGLNKTSNVPRS